MSPLNDDQCTSTTAAQEQQQDIKQLMETMTEEQKKAKAVEFFEEGKKQLACGNLPQADKLLSDSCTLNTGVYGDFGVECADAYFYYGQALLELARLEPGVFSNALQGVDEDSSMDEGEEDGEEVEGEEAETEGAKEGGDPEKEAEPAKEGEKAEGQEREEGEKEKEGRFENPDTLTAEEREDIHEAVEIALDENAEALKEGKVPDEPTDEELREDESAEEGAAVAEGEVDSTNDEPTTTDGEQATGDSSADDGGDEEQEGDVSNLQLAWEMFDMCRVICLKQEGEKWERRLCECLLSLGEVAIEDERYDAAVEDLSSCVERRRKTFPKEERAIAESLFQLARAYNLMTQFDQAAATFKDSVRVLEDKIAELTASLESAEKKEDVQKEIDNIKLLIPDIMAKVDDCMESAKQAAQLEKEKESAPASGFIQPTEDKPATDISGLVRKPVKRLAEASADEPEKKAKVTEDEENKGVQNGNKQVGVKE